MGGDSAWRPAASNRRTTEGRGAAGAALLPMRIDELVAPSWEPAAPREKSSIPQQSCACHTVGHCRPGRLSGLELLADAVCGRPAISAPASASMGSFGASGSADERGTHRAMDIKPKRKRANLHQLQRLREVFQQAPFPTADCRRTLAAQLGMTPRSVQIWFQNQRQLARNLVTFK